MKVPLRIVAVRYATGLSAIAILTAIDFYLNVNPTTVALLFLVAILFAAAFWGLRYAIVMAVVATTSFNYFFLPPTLTFTISDPQNWVALFAFLVTAIVASDLSERARREAEQAKQRRAEVEHLYELSQRLLSTDDVVRLLNTLPQFVDEAFSFEGVALLVSDHPTVYFSSPLVSIDEEALRTTIARGEPSHVGGAAFIPLRMGVRTVGCLAICGGAPSRETVDAISSLAGLAIERAHAVDALTKHRAMQENERLRSALLDSVTHEFRTPLTSIKASVTGLLSHYELNDSQRKELLTIIDEESDRLNRLVGEAAEMAQLDAGMVHLDLGPHPIREAIDLALDDTATALRDHVVTVIAPDDLPNARMDVARIREVLKHLLENAAKYSPPGSPIRITAELKGKSILTSVSDKGPGIDAFEQSLIFEKFYRGREQRSAAHGTGMGLAIAKVIVEAHRGEIGVVSQPGSGSVFSFTLPVQN